MSLHRRSFLRLLPAPLLMAGCGGDRSRVVLYCAQDREFAEGVLARFTEQTGLSVVPKYDTEANKSVSLYQEIVAEKDHPRCDVFWNNEIVSTIRLQRQGLLSAHDSPAAADYPSWAKAADHTWHAFAARARILLVNTKLVPEKERPRSLLDLTEPRWRGRVVMAKPRFGTTATQAACLFAVLGSERARAFYRGLKSNGVHVAPGNKQVAEHVGAGRTPVNQPAAVGLTDSDDAIDEVRAGREVKIVFPDRDGMGTLFIPNSLCIPRGCPNPEGARRLVDFLLGPDVERALAEGPGTQMPLNPKIKASLPPQIETPATVKAMEVDWGAAADVWDEAQSFLSKEIIAP
jgi:iron(III) transport system substrate-binding protein